MDTLNIVLITLSVTAVLEGLMLSIFSKRITAGVRKTFKNEKKLVKIGLIEMILGLLVLFLISL